MYLQNCSNLFVMIFFYSNVPKLKMCFIEAFEGRDVFNFRHVSLILVKLFNIFKSS